MASRVNTKLVVALVAGVIGVCVIGIGLYSFVLNRGPEDNVRDGDKAMAAGEYGLAKRMYGRAVNQDTNNLDWLTKYRGSIEAWQADTETAYKNEFNTAWRPLLRAMAMAQPTNIDASIEHLNLLYQLNELSGFPVSLVSDLDRETTAIVANMAAARPDDLERNRLRRYRALANVTQVQAQRVLSDQALSQTRDDLLAALDADPTDGGMTLGLMVLEQSKARSALSAGRWNEYLSTMAEARKLLTTHLGVDPDDPTVMLWLVALDIDVAFETAKRGTVGAARKAAIEQAMQAFVGRVDNLYAALLETDEPLELWQVRRFEFIETVVGRPEGEDRAMRLLDKMAQADPENAAILAYRASILKNNGQLIEAALINGQLTGLGTLPVGLPGMLRIHYQTQAYLELAEIALRQLMQYPDDDTAGRQAELAKAKANREEYASRKGLNDLELLYIDALIADAAGEPRAAITLLDRYVQGLQPGQTEARVKGMWMQGQVAVKLKEYGRARDAFRAVLADRPEWPNAIVALGQAEMALANPQEALTQLRLASLMMPGNQALAEQIRKLEVGLGLVSSDDPIEQALADSRAAMSGGMTEAPNVSRAKQILTDTVAVHGYNPILATELARIYLMERDLERAQDVISKSASANPDDELIVRLNEALQKDNLLDANLALIDSSPIDAGQKAVSRYRVLLAFDEPDRARAELDAAVRANPDDTVLIDLRFVDAIGRRDMASARAIYEAADKRGILGTDSLVYRARLEAVEGRDQEAIDTLTQAIELGATQAPVYRLLGTQLQATGMMQRALEAYQRAYDIKPDDLNNAKSLMQALYMTNQKDKALNIARDAQRFGRDDSQFTNMWLLLESEAGGQDGLARAITVREQIMSANPEDRTNRIRLAQLYIDVASATDQLVPDAARRENWAKAKAQIDDLKARQQDIDLVQLEARWLADQGRVPQDDGTTIDGIDAAQGVFIDYILQVGDDVTAEPFVMLAQFMMERGRYGVAESSLKNAREHQTEAREVDKILGSLYMDRRQNGAAAEIFQSLVEDGKDIEGSPFRIRWIEMLLRQGEFAKAQEQITKIPESMREDLTILLQRAEAADGLGNFAEATQLYDRAVALFPNSPLTYSRRAEFRLRDPNMLQDVLADLGQALSLDPANVQTLQIRAGVFARENRYEEMLADLKTALRANPQSSEILMSVMLEYLMQGQDGRAMDIVQETLRARPRDLMLIAMAAKVFEDREYWNRSETLYKRGWELSGEHGFGLAYINSLISPKTPNTREADVVLRQIRKMTGAAQTDWRVDFAEAAIQFKKGDKAKAETAMVDTYKKLLSEPGTLTTWLGNVTALYGEDIAGRSKFLRRVIGELNENPDGQAWARFYYAQSLATDEATRDEAASLFREMEALGDTSSFARFAYRQHGAMLYAAKLYEEAIVLWKEGLDMFPGDWEMSNNAAFCLAAELNRPADALPFALSAVEAAPEQAETYDSLARVYLGMREFDQAADVLESARRFSRSKRSDVSIAMTTAKLNIERGELSRARRSLERLSLGIGLIPDLREEFSSDIESLLRRIDSLGG